MRKEGQDPKNTEKTDAKFSAISASAKRLASCEAWKRKTALKNSKKRKRISSGLKMTSNDKWDLRYIIHVSCEYSTPYEKLRTKGQLISEWLFDILNFPKKQRKNLINSALESRSWLYWKSKDYFIY